MNHDRLVATVRALLQSAIQLRHKGELHAHKVRAQAYADGYMRALQDVGLLDQEQLLRIISEERARDSAAEVPALVAAG